MRSYYEISGPLRPFVYHVRRVVMGVRMAYFGTCKTREAAIKLAKKQRTIDAKTIMTRADWPIVDADYGTIIERR